MENKQDGKVTPDNTMVSSGVHFSRSGKTIKKPIFQSAVFKHQGREKGEIGSVFSKKTKPGGNQLKKKFTNKMLISKIKNPPRIGPPKLRKLEGEEKGKSKPKKSKEKKTKERKKTKEKKPNPKGEYGISKKSSRPKSKKLKKKLKKKGKLVGEKSQEMAKTNRSSDPGTDFTLKRELVSNLKKKLMPFSKRQANVSLGTSARSPVGNLKSLKLMRKIKRPILKTPLPRNNNFLSMTKKTRSKFDKKKMGSEKPKINRKFVKHKETKSPAKSKSKSTKKKSVKLQTKGGWYNKKLGKLKNRLAGALQKKPPKSVKLIRRQSRFGKKKSMKNITFASIDKQKDSVVLAEENEYEVSGYVCKKRSQSNKTDIKLRGGLHQKFKSKLLQKASNEVKEYPVKNVNNIRKAAKKAVLDESRSMDKMAKNARGKWYLGKEFYNSNRVIRMITFSGQKKHPSLNKLKLKVESKIKGQTRTSSGKPKKAKFNEYAQGNGRKKSKESANKKETPKSNLQTPRNLKKFIPKSSRSKVQVKLLEKMRKMAQARVDERKDPERPNTKKMKSSKDLFELPFTQTKKSAKKKKKSSKNLNEHKRKLFKKKSSQQLSIDKKFVPRLDKREKTPQTKRSNQKSGKASSSNEKSKKAPTRTFG